MVNWPAVRLDEIKADKKHALNGGPFGSKLISRDYVEHGVPVIRGTNIADDRYFSYENLVFVTEKKADELHANNAHPGDLIFTQRGTLGQIGVIPEDSPYQRYVISQSQMKLTVNELKIDPLYLYHYFRSPETVQQIKNLAISSGVPHINLAILRNFAVPLPPLDTQRRIAAVLSVHDDLIENNTQRIAALTAAAQALYREWFVEMRFPSHEFSRWWESKLGQIPSGWKVMKFGDLPIEIIDGDRSSRYPKRDELTPEGVLFLNTKVIQNNRLALENAHFISHEKYRQISKGRLEPLDIVLTTRGSIGRVALFNSQQYSSGIINAQMLILRAKQQVISPFYLYYFLLSNSFQHAVNNFASGAAQPQIPIRDLREIETVYPRHPLQQGFADIIASQENLIKKLQYRNHLLSEARDLLLPRLISGELSADEL